MKICLVNFTGGIPLGLAYLAASVSDGVDCEVRIVEGADERASCKKALEIVRSERPDIIGGTVHTCNVGDVLDFMRDVKAIAPEALTVVGGPHPTALPETMLAGVGVDLVVIGEGERTFSEIVRRLRSGLSLKDVDGTAYAEDRRVVVNRPRALIADLDELPYPAWKSLSIGSYRHPDYGHPRMNKPHFINMLATRGCPHSCTFCGAADVWGRKLRKHSPQRIADEMKSLHSEHGVRTVRFADSTFTADKRWVSELCSLLVDMNIDMAWSANARADTLDEKLLSEMASAKCMCLTVGVESGDETVLRLAKKHQRLQDVRRAFDLMRGAGIFSWAFFVIGLPGETRESIRRTIDFAEDLDPDQVSVCAYATPYPGTELYQMVKEEIGDDIPWADFHHSRKVLYVPRGLTRADIEEGKRLFCERLRPHERHLGRFVGV